MHCLSGNLCQVILFHTVSSVFSIARIAIFLQHFKINCMVFSYRASTTAWKSMYRCAIITHWMGTDSKFCFTLEAVTLLQLQVTFGKLSAVTVTSYKYSNSCRYKLLLPNYLLLQLQVTDILTAVAVRDTQTVAVTVASYKLFNSTTSYSCYLRNAD